MYTDLLFPLNVYAYILQSLEGKAEYLHFGLFDSADSPTLEAQQASTDLLLTYIPSPPLRILEVGVGLGALFGYLQRLGYEVTGINPDASQVTIAQQRLGNDPDIHICRFEDFSSDEQFDLILFQEVSQYIPLNLLFSTSAELIKPGGALLILDEMKSSGEVESNLHNADDYPEYAMTANFSVTDQQDLTTQARPTVDYLLSGIAELEDKLLIELNLGPEQLNHLVSSLMDYKKKYAEGDYVYKLFQFKQL